MFDLLLFMQRINRTNRAKGWNSRVPVDSPSVCGEKIALMHSELSEALEEFRAGRQPAEIYYKNAVDGTIHHDEAAFSEEPAMHKPEGVGIELADCIIRILDFCVANDIDIERCLVEKAKYNDTRPYRHGGKRS